MTFHKIQLLAIFNSSVATHDNRTAYCLYFIDFFLFCVIRIY